MLKAEFNTTEYLVNAKGQRSRNYTEPKDTWSMGADTQTRYEPSKVQVQFGVAGESLRHDHSARGVLDIVDIAPGAPQNTADGDQQVWAFDTSILDSTSRNNILDMTPLTVSLDTSFGRERGLIIGNHSDKNALDVFILDLRSYISIYLWTNHNHAVPKYNDGEHFIICLGVGIYLVDGDSLHHHEQSRRLQSGSKGHAQLLWVLLGAAAVRWLLPAALSHLYTLHGLCVDVCRLFLWRFAQDGASGGYQLHCGHAL